MGKVVDLLCIPSPEKKSIGIVDLLIQDHERIRDLMKKVSSPRTDSRQKSATFRKLEKLVDSHVAAEELALMSVLKDHPRFKDLVKEAFAEHQVHDLIRNGLRSKLKNYEKAAHMKAFCEVLEHHLDEEEEKLFPRFRKYAASSTRKKLGARYLRERRATAKNLHVPAPESRS
ncbi:MAG: hemerythrin domain-containing protein [Bdellovibrionota bacterium]